MKKETGKQGNQIPFVDIVLQVPSSFHIKTIQKNIDIEDDEESSHRHSFQEIFWIKSGSGTQSIDDRILKISPGTFYIISKGQVHKVIEGYDLDGLIIQFHNDFILDLPFDQTWTFSTSLFSCISVEGVIPIEKSNVRDFEILLDQVQKEYNLQKEFGKNQVLRHLLNIILIKLQRILKDRLNENEWYSDQHTILKKFMTQLDEDYNKEHLVTHYAGTLGVSSRSLSEITKNMLGKTAKEVILERLLLEAKRYLNYSALSVKEIAYTLGYEDPSYFSKLFKQNTSQSPQDYRKNVQQNWVGKNKLFH